MDTNNVPAEVHSLLYQLGLTANYTGFFHTAYSIYLAACAPHRLNEAAGHLYADVAEQFSTSPAAVERSIRMSVTRVWQRDPDRLDQLFAHPLTSKPSNLEFLSALAAQPSLSALHEIAGPGPAVKIS